MARRVWRTDAWRVRWHPDRGNLGLGEWYSVEAISPGGMAQRVIATTDTLEDALRIARAHRA